MSEHKDATMEDDEPDPVLIDALPYIDTSYGDESTKAMVDELVAQEMERSEVTPEEFLLQLGLPEPVVDMKKSIFLAKEFDRMDAGEELTPVDMSRYSLAHPTGKDAKSVAAWQKAVERAMIQLEHQTTSTINVELLRRFGPNSWKTSNEYVSEIHDRLQMALKQQKKEMDDLNRARRSAQVQVMPQMQRLEQEFQEKMAKTHEIEFACRNLETEISAMKKRDDLRSGKGPSKKKQKIKNRP